MAISMQDPSKGKGVFVRRKEISGMYAAVMGLIGRVNASGAVRPNEHVECEVRNQTGATRDEFCVVKLGDSLFNPANSNELNDYKFGYRMFEAEEIDEDDSPVFAILQDPLNDDGSLCPAVYAGVSLVRLTGPADMASATTQDGLYSLVAVESGPCTILYDPGPGDMERFAIVRIGGGGSCECEEIHKFWTNGPTAGTFEATYLINAVSETITWDFDATDADVQTAFEGHSEIGSGNVEVWGGPWPFVSLYVKFIEDLEATSIPFPAIDNASLTNGDGFMDKYSYVEEG